MSTLLFPSWSFMLIVSLRLGNRKYCRKVMRHCHHEQCDCHHHNPGMPTTSQRVGTSDGTIRLPCASTLSTRSPTRRGREVSPDQRTRKLANSFACKQPLFQKRTFLEVLDFILVSLQESESDMTCCAISFYSFLCTNSSINNLCPSDHE